MREHSGERLQECARLSAARWIKSLSNLRYAATHFLVMTDLTPDLQFLVGEPVSGIGFIMDYVELQFNGSYLRCLEPPTITLPGADTITFPAAGSRDALCALIERTLQGIRAEDDGELFATFSNGATLQVNLAHASRRSPEAIHFHDQATGETQFW
jgi:hypothetical protein